MNGELDQLAFNFFKLFARYESTLKEQGFFRAERETRIVVEWDRFASEVIGGNFMEDLGDSSKYAEFILDEPPMRQAVNEDGLIIWKPVSNDIKTVQNLFAHIRRVRNNLHHGAKFNATWNDPERSRALLEASLVILEHYKSRIGID